MLPVTDFEDAWQAWRDTRETRLRGPRGWLAIIAIHWLTDTPERYADVPGAWSGTATAATVTLDAGEALTVAGRLLETGTHDLGPVDEEGVRVEFGDAVADVADRDGRTIVRPRHPDSPTLRAYRGTPCYAPDPAWALPGHFTAYDGPRGEAIGEVTFTHDGAEHRLVAWDDDEGGLWILFRDATSGVTTYPANRQLVVDPPAPDGTVTLDLNRAYNMPCAYTDFATCPLPPPENTLPFPVEAGERIPAFS
ncbi:DUF1684 domain-containing protein [Nocardioides sp. LS1]|uniref:DUF1684 domain-containing protein n=1 Tax=Nocardioides sp. LS1 TaxID=1027620 RepID=UPI000F627DA9|nr:DUF1684 domain-containing protein [Nocardioides sp. LS1]GCD88575.1 hypothetical protein NLS1_05810 [Nocardioides sp. LS1]